MGTTTTTTTSAGGGGGALVLVTGAAGKTGAPVVRLLLERGLRVRALVRREDDRAAALAAMGADIVVGDMHDMATVRRAMRGVMRVYFVYPPQGGRLVEATAIAGEAARAAGVRGFVNMSQLPAREDGRSALSRHHWLGERILDRSGVGAVHIRPTFFSEMLLILGGQTIVPEGRIVLPYADARHAPVGAEEIARCVTEILVDPGTHEGRTYVLTGPRSMTISEMAGVLGAELGRDVKYVQVPVDAWGEILRTQLGLPEFLVRHLEAVAQDHAEGVFDIVTDDVQRITGRPARELNEFVREHRRAFESPDPSISSAA